MCDENSINQILQDNYQFEVLSKSESVICLFTDSSVKKYFLLLNQSNFTDNQ